MSERFIGIPEEIRKLNLPYNVEEYITTLPKEKRQTIIYSILTSKSEMSPSNYRTYLDRLESSNPRELEIALDPSHFPNYELPSYLYGVSPVGIELPDEEESTQIIYPQEVEYYEEADVFPSLVPHSGYAYKENVKKENLTKEIHEIRNMLEKHFSDAPKKFEIVHRYEPSVVEYKNPKWSLIDTTVNGELELYKTREGYVIIVWINEVPHSSSVISSFSKAEREYDRLKNMYGVY